MNFDLEEEVVIIGGGVAGLCAAIELCRHGITPTLIEAGNYPAHKVCGEFLSPESLPWLKELNIEPCSIREVQFQIGNQKLHYPFPVPAGSLSHIILDPMLVQQARNLGANIRTEVQVQAFYPKKKPKEKHVLQLSTGETVSADTIFIATGRLNALSSSFPTSKIKYMGIKAHFEGLDLGRILKMYGFSGAYLGLSPIEEGKANLACLVTIKRLKKAKSIDQMMIDLISENQELKEMLFSGKRLFEDWMHTPIPFFGWKNTPNWLDAYFIGDAAMSIPPVCGEGLSLAMTSGIMAARYAVARDFLSFKANFQSLCLPPIRIAKGMHYLMMHPLMGKLSILGCSLFPTLKHWLFKSSRHLPQ